MSSKIIYEVLSRVVNEEKEVIGFMVKLKNKMSSPIFMSIDVLVFGLANKNFEVVNVKLGGNGKPRGYNGFLLSKLPIEVLESSEEVFAKLLNVLNYIIKDISYDSEIKYDKVINGINANYTATFNSLDYKNMDIDLAETELNKTLKFYQRHLPKELKKEIDKVMGEVSEKGLVSVTISKSLVSGV